MNYPRWTALGVVSYFVKYLLGLYAKIFQINFVDLNGIYFKSLRSVFSKIIDTRKVVAIINRSKLISCDNLSMEMCSVLSE
jgi:hypothetical protein